MHHQNSSGSSHGVNDLFEPGGAGGGAGFTFDAFGLDASQMNAQLNRAMHDLAGSHPEIMMNGPFLSNVGDASSSVHSASSPLPPSKWNEASPTRSRSSTPIAAAGPPMPAAAGGSDEGGFVDGFRVSKRHMHSPSGSTEKSSITSETSSQDRSGLGRNGSNHGSSRRPRIVRPLGNSMQPKLQTHKVAAVATTSSSSRSRLRRPPQDEIEFVDVESDVVLETDQEQHPHAPQQQQQQSSLRQTESVRPQQQQPFGSPSSIPFPSTQQQQQQPHMVMGRPEIKQRTIENENLFAPPPTSSDPGGPSDLGPAEFGDFGGQNSNAPSEVGAQSDMGVQSDFFGSTTGVRSNVPSDAGVSSDVGVNGDLGGGADLFHRRPTHDSSIPLQVFSSSLSSSKRGKALRNNHAKGSQDTATTVSTGYSSNALPEQQQPESGNPVDHKSRTNDNNINPSQFEEKKDDYDSLRSRWENKDKNNNSSPQQPSPLTSAYLQALQTQFSREEQQNGSNVPSPEAFRRSQRGGDAGGAKSEGGVRFSRPTETVNAVMDRLTSPRGGKGQALSDVGSTPEYLRVKLRRTGASTDDPSPTQSSQGHDSNQENNVPEDVFGGNRHGGERGDNSWKSEQPVSMVERSKTYQQRREREMSRPDEQHHEHAMRNPSVDEQDDRALHRQLLQEDENDVDYHNNTRDTTVRQQHQQQHPASSVQEEPKQQPERDVATLIRRRIAANKRSAEQERMQQEQSSPSENVSQQPRNFRQVDVASSNGGPPMFEQSPISPARRSNYPQAEVDHDDEPAQDPRDVMMQMLKARGAAASAAPYQEKELSKQRSPSRQLDSKPSIEIAHTRSSLDDHHVSKSTTPKATKMMLNAFLAGRESVGETGGAKSIASASKTGNNDGRPALKDDPEYERYFKMLKLGMPIDVVKHAMTRDGVNASVMDGDHNKPVPVAGVPLKDDPEYEKYFKMLKIGMPMDAVKHAMLRDGLDCSVMDQDHNLPVGKKGDETLQDEPKEKDSHRRARLHWKTLRKVTSNSLWARLDQDISMENIEIDENEFQELFQVEKGEDVQKKTTTSSNTASRSTTVRVIDGKRANNGGIILARLKMSHDEMADAVDRINENVLSAEQIENIIEYLPSKEERRALESYMLEGGQDAAEKFDGLCECEKFMVSMMTVKHAKRKVRALLFKLQFEQCLDDILQDTLAVESACDELFNSVRLRQLLGIILTFGNRLNTAGNKKRKAGAFTLDSLLKLNQAKAFDKKTTFLHYVILIVQRNNEILLRFKDDLPTVFKADKVFWDQCLTDLDGVESQLENVRRIALYQARQAHGYRLRRHKSHSADDGDESLSDGEISLTLEEEVEALRATPIGIFTLSAIKYVSSLRDKVEETRSKFTRLLEYFGEEETTWHPHELFSTIAQFCRDFDKAKDEVLANEKKKQREERKRQSVAGKPPTHSTPDRRQQQERTPDRRQQQEKTLDRRQPEKKMLRASSFQPSISAVMRSNQPTSAGSEARESKPRYSAPPQVPLHDARRRDEPNSETVMLNGRPESSHHNEVPYQPYHGHIESAGVNHHDFPHHEDVSERSILAAVEEEGAMPSPGGYEQYGAIENYSSPQSTPTRQPSVHATSRRSRSNPTPNDHRAMHPSYHTPDTSYSHVSMDNAMQREPPLSRSTHRSDHGDGNKHVHQQTRHESFDEPPAPTNVRSASMSALRHKARMKGKLHHRATAAPPVHSNSVPLEAETATTTPFVSMQSREPPLARHEQAPSPIPSAPQALHGQSSDQASVDESVHSNKPKQMSPRSSFRHKRRMEVRERMRQEKASSTNPVN